MASDVVVFDRYATLLLWRVVTLRSTAVICVPELIVVCVCGLYASTQYCVVTVLPVCCSPKMVSFSEWCHHGDSMCRRRAVAGERQQQWYMGCGAYWQELVRLVVVLASVIGHKKSS